MKKLKVALSKGHSLLSLSTLTRWFNQFKRGLDDLIDKHLPITQALHAKIERVRIPYDLLMKLKPRRQPSLVALR
jgi:hypothetical protein